MSDDKNKSDDFWRQQLTPEEFHICREKGTELGGSGVYYREQRQGCYFCKCCGMALFESSSKYDSGSGWPSFFDVIGSDRVVVNRDLSHGMVRSEITCAKCDCHLGHLFSDGPVPTGKRYCVNSASLLFKTADEC